MTFAVDFMTRDPALQPLARALDYAVFAPFEDVIEELVGQIKDAAHHEDATG